MSILRDASILLQLAKGMPREGSHADRLRRFYAPQAQHYDAFRERLLHGRRELIARLPLGPGARVVELGAGTGRNVEFFGERRAEFASIELVDVCTPLLAIARERFSQDTNVKVIETTAEQYQPNEPVDCVYFCYSLSMMANWAAAVGNAVRMLKPGGHIAVVDFYLPDGARRLPIPLAKFWKQWFARDGVHLSDQLLIYLQCQSRTLYVHEGHIRIPYLPVLSAPYMMYVGQRAA